MNSSKITEGVGKKIVEALKHQSDVEIVPVKEEELSLSFEDIKVADSAKSALASEPVGMTNAFEEANNNIAASFNMNNVVDNALNNTLLNFKTTPIQEVNLAAVEDMELPANVAALKQLITKIPTGVSKQTGALIIKQTMEALGVSMTNVLQEAQQVQEQLTQSVRECQTNVLEYKKQINILEVQAQKYQRQFAAINDIISLFIQTNN